MSSAQGDRQRAIRVQTGTTLTYEGDWHALFDKDGIATGTFNNRLLAWINLALNTSHTNLMDAMEDYAEKHGANSWEGLGFHNAVAPGSGSIIIAPPIQTAQWRSTTFQAIVTLAPAGGEALLLEDGSGRLIREFDPGVILLE
jgi:hypothetical protein